MTGPSIESHESLEISVLNNKPDVSLPGFFEGPEKLLEIIFEENQTAATQPAQARLGLRRVPNDVWSSMLADVGCEIVSAISSAQVDAYLLSESSMFVYSNRIMIKTCGSITLLLGLERLLNIAATHGYPNVVTAFYSRKNFLEPTRQLFPHNGFDAEIKFLEDVLGKGRAHTLGRVNGDHWNLFILEPKVTMPLPTKSDMTLEILMHDLDQDAVRHFYRGDNFINSNTNTIASGIAALVPSAHIDDLVFDPCGYSANALTDEHYFTIHVTPQAEFSYASFETNVPPGKQYNQLISQVLNIFKPGRFTITLFASHDHNDDDRAWKFFDWKKVGNYVRNDKSCHHFGHYSLLYCHFSSQKKPL